MANLKVAEHRGVTSRARKSILGQERVPDPKYGGRPSHERSKSRPPKMPRA